MRIRVLKKGEYTGLRFLIAKTLNRNPEAPPNPNQNKDDDADHAQSQSMNHFKIPSNNHSIRLVEYSPLDDQ